MLVRYHLRSQVSKFSAGSVHYLHKVPLRLRFCNSFFTSVQAHPTQQFFIIYYMGQILPLVYHKDPLWDPCHFYFSSTTFPPYSFSLAFFILITLSSFAHLGSVMPLALFNFLPPWFHVILWRNLRRWASFWQPLFWGHQSCFNEYWILYFSCDLFQPLTLTLRNQKHSLQLLLCDLVPFS